MARNPFDGSNVELDAGFCIDARRSELGGLTVLTIAKIETDCDAKGVTLVMHPAIRQAVCGFEESFYIGARCFLRGEADGAYFLPLRGTGYVRLAFSKRVSPGGHPILRVDPLNPEGLRAVKASLQEET